MRGFWTQALLGLTVLSGALAAPPVERAADAHGHGHNDAFHREAEPQPGAIDSQAKAAEAAAAAAAAGAGPLKVDTPASPEGTFFNNKLVPPITMLTGKNLQEETSKDTWMVEFFSPHCGHCKRLAPVYQTLYEFYYTSDPIGSATTKDTDASLNSFSRFYNFKFAKVDCVAWGDACADAGVTNYPTIYIYKDGEIVDKHVGVEPIKFFSDMVEKQLEIIRPGSRPADGPELPKAKDNASPDFWKGTTGGSKEAVAGGKDSEVAADSKDSKDSTGAQDTKAGKDVSGKTGTGKGKGTGSDSKPAKGKPRVSRPVETPNPAGISRPLTAESFQKLVTASGEPWFVKFYAPWCHHCQAMQPNWAEMAREMKGKLNIGEVNCDVEKRLCKDAKVRGYPTISLFRAGEKIEYDGLRGLGDLISFGKKAIAVADGVLDVDAESFKKLEETEEVIFLYCYDHATTSEDFEALERLVLSLVGHARLVKTNDHALFERFDIRTWPRLLVSRDGRPSYYTGLSPRDMRDYRQVLNWMQSVWLPLVVELTANNAREIMEGQILVLGILNRDKKDQFSIARKEMKNAALEWMDKETQAFRLQRQELRDAKQLRIEEAEDRNDQRAYRAAKQIRINMDEIKRKEVAFAWVDAVFWEHWIRTTYGIDALEGDRVIINDEDNRRYWDQTITGNAIVASRTSILETIPKVIANPPKITPKSTASSLEHLWLGISSLSFGHPWLAILLVGSIVSSTLYFGRSHVRRGGRLFGGSGGYFQLEGKEGILGVSGAGAKSD